MSIDVSFCVYTISWHGGPLGMGWQCITSYSSVAQASAPPSSFGFGPSSAQIPLIVFADSNANFAMVHYSASDHATESMPALSYQRLQTIQPLSDEDIRRIAPNKHCLQVLESFLIFNKHMILKIKFYQPTKVALSFRLDPEPGFLPEVEHPKKPFAVIGNEFRRFHIRFRDVARGGIRIVMSRNKEMYSINQRMLFDENYNLASTQSLKNKDIPEGGAKGTILPSIGATPRLCFEKYVDAIVDLLIPGKTPGIKETLVDLYEKPELLFFGPDEGTADKTDWTALHARDRNVVEVLHHWKEQYVLGIYKQLGLKEREITKHLTVAHFDRTRLSKDGYLVKIEEQDVKLPSGEIVLDGIDFRNGTHLRFKADLFVPCGGRPEAVNMSNMAALFDSEGKPHFKYIVEGANLFLTQQARLFLGKRKVVVFKDSSTNKGGVTSSSLEVLAGLALSTQEYVDSMIFKDSKPSEFHQSYVKDIQEKITENAAAEFHCMWKEHTHLQGAKPRTTISDELSSTLNNLQAELESSDLFEYVPSRNGVIRRAIPKALVEKIGLETLLKRLPEAYQRALFSSWAASHFIYKYGVNASSVDFFHFARDLSK
ncbi:NAD(P)-binding protein [Gymnopus androsaceus JB14]|uniref:NAD(P)-binding protein n=1 Tax=Gymnopus androsaceus JB14 TaxID=1447944 RepID=A0A6A4GWL0_9AGAR|nr:NAD(P)-binding protein [Gymnopus androsaceus JB14]